MIAAGGDADSREPRGGDSDLPGDKSTGRKEVESGLRGEEWIVREKRQSQRSSKVKWAWVSQKCGDAVVCSGVELKVSGAR